jgi:3',5'-cyclic AMP phosphodiesterase CpdA
MKLLHITDLHLHGDPYALSDRRLKNCVIHLSNAHADADLCIITGDISENGTEAGYAAARDLLSELPFPVYATLGNHDCRQSAKAALPAFAWDAAGFCQRIVETASHTLILLDTLDEGRHGGVLCYRRLRWAAEALRLAQGRPVVLAMHHAPFATGLSGMDCYGLAAEASSALAALVLAHGNVRHLFFGHYHRQISGCWQGIPFSSLPSFSQQCALALSDPERVPMTDGPTHYAVALFAADQTVIHSEALPEPSSTVAQAFPIIAG